MATENRTSGGGPLGLLAGAPRYEPSSPWSPGPALLAAVGASLIPPLVILFALEAPQPALDPSIGGPVAEQYQPGVSLDSAFGLAAAITGQLGSIALIWLASRYRGPWREVLQLTGAVPGWRTLVVGGLLVVAGTGLVEALLYLTTRFDVRADARFLIDGLSGPYWWGVVVMAVVLAPLWEELVYRGFLLSALARSRLGFWGGALVANSLWTMLHMDYSWQGLASVFTAGLVLSWLLWRTGSIWAPVAAHAIANASALVFMLYLGPGG